MDKQQKNIMLVGLYRIFSRMYFYLTILFPLFYIHGQDVLEIEILLAVYGLSIVFLSEPVKLLTNRIGHKNALILGEVFKIFGLICLIFYAGDFNISLFSQFLMGLGYTLIVGNDTVILQQNFGQKNSEEYQNIQSKTNSYMFISLFFSGLSGALIFQYSSIAVLALSIFAAFLSIFSILPMQYVQEIKDHKAKANLIVDSQAKTYYYLIRGLVLPVFVGILPYLFFVLINTGMDWFAIIISSFTLSGFVSSKYLPKYLKGYSFTYLTSGSLLLVLLSLLLLLSQNMYLCFIATCMFGLVSGCVRPITVSKIDNKRYSTERTLKQAEFHYGLFNSLILLLAGMMLMHHFSFNVYILILVGLSAIYGYTRICFLSKGKKS